MATKPLDLFDVEAEEATLGALLLDPAAYARVEPLITAGDFYIEINGWLFEAVAALHGRGEPIDELILLDELKHAGRLDDVGGLARIVQLTNAVPSALHVEKYAQTVREFSQRRRALAIFSEAAAVVCDRNGHLPESLEATEAAIAELRADLVAPLSPIITLGEIRSYFGDVTWAWPSWMPVGYLTLLVGPQACGKSFLAARLMATLSGCYERWPDGTPLARCGFDKLPAKVLLVETEEMRGVYAERLKKMTVEDHWVLVGPGDEVHIPDLLKEADIIERLVLQENIGAVIVDSLSGGHRMKEESATMRTLLTRYAAMAGRLQVPIILVHHVRKRGELESMRVTLDRVRGSTTITQFCRSVIALYRLEDGDQVSPVRVEVIKSTFCAPPPSLGFVVTDEGLIFVDAPEPVRTESQIDKACDLLLALLGGGPVATTDLQDEANGAGISWRTMKRAKQQLGVIARREKPEEEDKAHWSWALPAGV